jgi:hypothetical protein
LNDEENLMPDKNLSRLEMNSPAIYIIKVKGRLSNQWANWFNGTLANHERIYEDQALTSLTCRVRDQAELLGILKQLNALNLPIQEVVLSTFMEIQKN